MKRFLTKSIAIMVAFVIILAIATIPASATSETCVEDHFSNLSTLDVGAVATPPSETSCYFVAISLLLTFYDSYWNDQFVYGNQGWTKGVYNSSTDKLERTFAATEEAADWQDYILENNISAADHPTEYIYYAFQNSHVFLESYLVSLAINPLDIIDFGDESLGMNIIEAYQVLQQYLINRDLISPGVTIRFSYGSDEDAIALTKKSNTHWISCNLCGKENR